LIELESARGEKGEGMHTHFSSFCSFNKIQFSMHKLMAMAEIL